MLDLGALFALLVRQKNKAAVTEENTPQQKKKTNSLFLSLGQKLNDSEQFTT